MDSFKLKPNSLTELKEAIEKFKELRNETNYDIIKNRFFDLFGIFPVSFMFNDVDSLKNLKLFRACPAEKVILRGVDKISSYLGPPKNMEIGNQRANWNGRNVFYAGDSPFVTIVENKKIQVGHEYFISQWEFDLSTFREDKIPISFLTHNNLSHENVWDKIIPTKKQMKEHLMKTTNIEENDAELLTDFVEEISSLFSDENRDYNLTGFIADNTIYHQQEISLLPRILIYPSVETNKKACNIAIHPDFAEKHLKLVKIVKITIGKVFEDKFDAKYNCFAQVELKKVQFYHFNIDPNKAVYIIDNFKCSCSFKFKISNPEKCKITFEDNVYNLKEVIDKEINKWIKKEDLISYNSDLFETKGITIKKILKATIPLPNYKFVYKKKEHIGLYCEVTVEQPIDFIKNNDIRFGMNRLTPNIQIIKRLKR